MTTLTSPTHSAARANFRGSAAANPSPIAAARVLRGMTQSTLAVAAGLCRPTVACAETQCRDISFTSAMAIVRALHRAAPLEGAERAAVLSFLGLHPGLLLDGDVRPEAVAE